LERVDDTGVIQLYADGFENLELRDKILCYHLANAALAGRDIFIDQKFAHGLAIRDLLEELYVHRQTMTPASKAEIERYTKLFWLNNGIHDHLSTLKRRLNISLPDYQAALRAARKDGARLPSAHEVSELYSVMTDPNTFRSCTNKSPANEADPLEASCNNLYFNISSVDLERFEEKNALNSRLVKKGGNVTEEVYRAGDPESRIPPGRYARQLRRVNKHLALAAAIAPEKTRVALELLIKYYKTGEFADWHAYNVA
jgi:dipeptidyl-peptidase-3